MGKQAGVGTPAGVFVTFKYSEVSAEGVLSPALLTARAHLQPPTGGHGSRLASVRQVLKELGGGFFVGDEPGTEAYSDQATGHVFVKTSALSSPRLGVVNSRQADEHVFEYGFTRQDLRAGDVLIAKDGPVGSASMFDWEDDEHEPMISSGIMRLRFPAMQWFYFAVLRFGDFADDIERLTPTGATYLHAGQDLILDFPVPKPGADPKAEARLSLLAFIATMAERQIGRRYRGVIKLLDNYAGTTGLDVRAPRTSIVRLSDTTREDRLDATVHRALTSDFWKQISAVGVRSLEDHVSAHHVGRERGQNLQYTAIGFSEKHDEFRQGSYRLIEPGFVESDMFIPRWRWLWCPRPLKTIQDGSVIFSAEGSIGNVGVVYALGDHPTVSNIHAIILDSARSPREVHNAWLVANIAFFRDKGWLDAASVGGQGGSLALKYHHLVPILNWSAEVGRWVGEAIVRRRLAPSTEELRSMTPNDLRAYLHASRTWSVGDLSELRANAVLAARELLFNRYPELA